MIYGDRKTYSWEDLEQGFPQAHSSAYSAGLAARVRRMREAIIAVVISTVALLLIVIIRLITLFWPYREAPEMSLRDVEGKK
jgi:hypothetical protein